MVRMTDQLHVHFKMSVCFDMNTLKKAGNSTKVLNHKIYLSETTSKQFTQKKEHVIKHQYNKIQCRSVVPDTDRLC